MDIVGCILRIPNLNYLELYDKPDYEEVNHLVNGFSIIYLDDKLMPSMCVTSDHLLIFAPQNNHDHKSYLEVLELNKK